MFVKRSEQRELLDDLSLNHEALKRNLDEMERINRWAGSKQALISSLNCVRKKLRNYFHDHTVVIGDIGCGNGDLLRAIHQWSATKNVEVELIGLDINPESISYATAKSLSHPTIKYQLLDVLTEDFNQQTFDIICVNNVCHHFSDTALVALIATLIKQTKLALIINDLHRHWLSYCGAKCLFKLLNYSAVTKFDGPLSILRAFRRSELQNLLAKASISNYKLTWAWAFRWKVVIWCNE
jgi:2-polyprenyl-3-methyl-5-hydroxy-6-metoxy-1,4-benzoquinol methylase